MAKKTYRINYRCRNCGKIGTKSVVFGHAIGEAVCPHCGCETLTRQDDIQYYDGDWKRELDKWRTPNQPWWYPPEPMCSTNKGDKK